MKKQALLSAILFCLTVCTKAQYLSIDKLITLRNYSLSEVENYLTVRNWTFIDASKETTNMTGTAKFAFGRSSIQTNKAELYVTYMYSSSINSKRLNYQLHKPTEYSKLITGAKNLGYTLYRSIINDNEIFNVYKKGNLILRFNARKSVQDYRNVTLYSVLILSYGEYATFDEEISYNKNAFPNITSWDKNTLQKQINLIDDYIKKNSENIFVYAGPSVNEDGIYESEPERVESVEDAFDMVAYQIVKNDDNKIIALIESPMYGDSFIEFTHYFDENGKTFAYKQQHNSAKLDDNGQDVGGNYETIVEYYNRDFKRLAREYRLLDEEDRLLKDNCSTCGKLYQKVYANLHTLKNKLKFKKI